MTGVGGPYKPKGEKPLADWVAHAPPTMEVPEYKDSSRATGFGTKVVGNDFLSRVIAQRDREQMEALLAARPKDTHLRTFRICRMCPKRLNEIKKKVSLGAKSGICSDHTLAEMKAFLGMPPTKFGRLPKAAPAPRDSDVFKYLPNDQIGHVDLGVKFIETNFVPETKYVRAPELDIKLKDGSAILAHVSVEVPRPPVEIDWREEEKRRVAEWYKSAPKRNFRKEQGKRHPKPAHGGVECHDKGGCIFGKCMEKCQLIPIPRKR